MIFFVEVILCKGTSCYVDRLLKKHKSIVCFLTFNFHKTLIYISIKTLKFLTLGRWRLKTVCKKFLKISCCSLFIFILGKFPYRFRALFHAHTSAHHRIFTNKGIDSLALRLTSYCELPNERRWFIVLMLYQTGY